MHRTCQKLTAPACGSASPIRLAFPLHTPAMPGPPLPHLLLGEQPRASAPLDSPDLLLGPDILADS